MTIYSIQERYGRCLWRWLTFCGAATAITVGGYQPLAIAAAPGSSGMAVPAGWNQSTGSPAQTGNVNFDGADYRVVKAAAYTQGGDKTNKVMQANGLAASSVLAQQSNVVPVSYSGGCTTCGTSACGGACGTGNYGGYAASYGMPCGIPCDPYSYVSIEGLFMRRTGDERYTVSPDFALDEFEYEWAPRITMGTVPDCENGYEVSFVGILEWDMAASLNPATTFLTSDPTITPNLGAVNGPSVQAYDAEFWSLEASRTLVGWEVAKVLYGFRYIDYSEDYVWAAGGPTARSLTSRAENQLIGLQIGLDLLYPISCHGYADFRGRAGAYLNLAETDVRLLNNNANTAFFANFDDDEELAGFFELGSGVRYQLGEALSIRGGVEFWYLSGVATSITQFGPTLSSSTGRNLNADDDIFFLGLSFGAEFKY